MIAHPTYPSVFVHTLTHIHALKHIHIYTFIHSFTHIHTHTHTLTLLHTQQAAWHLSPAALPILGSGDNALPTIHIRDLCQVLQGVSESLPETRYVLAVDDGQSTQGEIAAAVSATLGTGKVASIKKEDALQNPDFSQREYDSLLTKLRLEGNSVKTLKVQWESQGGLIEALDAVTADFKKSRHLQVCSDT